MIWVQESERWRIRAERSFSCKRSYLSRLPGRGMRTGRTGFMGRAPRGMKWDDMSLQLYII